MRLDKAIRIAAVAHEGQFDKGGHAYITHPLRVMMKMKTEDEAVVAALHDVVEDTRETFQSLTDQGLTSTQLVALDGVTRRDHESYSEFIDRAGDNEISRMVKMADLEDNMNLNRIPHPTKADWRRLAKYAKAHKKLETTS
jgi:(p)ppGpp synthase/HD superfamily hydrolase